MGLTRQYIYKLVKESKLRASHISGKKSLIRRADIELMMKTKSYERIMPKEDFDITEYYTAEEIAEKYSRDLSTPWRHIAGCSSFFQPTLVVSYQVPPFGLTWLQL